MVNVNEILKRQLLLMKFDSGVTLKENYEKVSGKRVLSEGAMADKVKSIVDGCYTRDNNLDRTNVESSIHRTVADMYKQAIEYKIGMFVATDCDKINDASAMVREQFSYRDLCQMIFTYDAVHGGDGFYEDIDNDIQSDSYDCGWGTIQQAFQAAVDKSYKMAQSAPAPVVSTPVETTPVEAAKPESGSSGVGKQGWDMGKAIAKYTCLSGNDLAWRDVMSDDSGDVIKLNIGKTREGGQIYARLYLQDGYMNQWDYPYGRIGGENQYAVCRNNKLSFQTGKNTSMTDASTGKPQMESVNKFGKLIKEAIDLEIVNAAGGEGSGDFEGTNPKEQKPQNPKPKPRRKGSNNTVCINKVQNLLKELNPAFNVSGSMDNNTLIEIMNKLNELETSLTVTKDEVAVIEKPKYFPSIDITEP